MPPPSKSNFLSGQTSRRTHYPITHLTLHPQPGNRMLAKLHTGSLPKHISSKFYSQKKNHNDQYISTRFNFGETDVPYSQLSSIRFNSEKSRYPSHVSTSFPVNSNAGSLFRDQVTSFRKSNSPQTLAFNGDLHPPPFQSQRFEGFQGKKPGEAYQINPPFNPPLHFNPAIRSTKFSKLRNREAKSKRLEENLIDYKSIAAPHPLSNTKVTSIRFEEDSDSINNEIPRSPLSRPFSTQSINLLNENSFSTSPEPQIVWGKPDSRDVPPREETSLSFGDFLYPPLTNNKIIFPSDELNDIDSWKPIPKLPTLSSADTSFSQPPLKEASKLLAPWTSEAPAIFNSDSTSHHLFVRTTPFTSSPSFRFRSDVGKRNTRPETQKLAPFFARFSTQPPLELEDSEYVIPLNSSERIQNLIYFLSMFLTGPPHQSQNALAVLSDSDRQPKLLQENLPEDFSVLPLESHWTEGSAETISEPAQSPKFRNGFLDFLHLNSSIDYLKALEIQVRPSAKSQELVEDNSDSTRPAVETPPSRETPQPVKINIFQDLDYFEDDPFDLVRSPSISTLLGVVQVSNSTNNTENEITSELDPLGNKNTKSKVIIISAKTSECPKLYGQVDLLCEMNASIDDDIMTISWNKIVSTSGTERSHIILSQDARLLTSDAHITLLDDTPPNTYALRVTSFRSEDVGTYECKVRSVEGDEIAAAQVTVFACL
ncbi:Immunoglobulin V-set domain [Trinorchestia longiramus]|nr:Immunoglobulin V-set domain [Trinorchestia longiramus]